MGRKGYVGGPVYPFPGERGGQGFAAEGESTMTVKEIEHVWCVGVGTQMDCQVSPEQRRRTTEREARGRLTVSAICDTDSESTGADACYQYLPLLDCS